MMILNGVTIGWLADEENLEERHRVQRWMAIVSAEQVLGIDMAGDLAQQMVHSSRVTLSSACRLGGGDLSIGSLHRTIAN